VAAQENPDRLLQQAIAFHQSGDTERAIPQYRAYLKLRPDAVDARSNLGAALAAAGRYREAIVEYREALQRRPGEPHIRLNLALAHYKQGQISRGRFPTRRPSSQPCIANSPRTVKSCSCWPIAGCARERTAR
jgi:Flp pilus assembly protein TadD